MYAIPSFRDRFLSYGSRSSSSPRDNSRTVPSSTSKNIASSKDREPRRSNNAIGQVLDHLATWQVPHSYFIHFYFLSVISSILWAHQLYTRGPAFRLIAQHASTPASASMSKAQVTISCTLMLIQGLRRLYESITFNASSSSRMWFAHWLLGLAFYAAMGIAVWLEGATSLLDGTYSQELFNKRDLFKLVRISNIAALVLFVQASAGQHQAHKHLFELRTKSRDAQDASSPYSLPSHPLFRTTLTPHYACECLIYFSLCIVAAPAGALVNRTLLCALVFVAVNLGVTADGTREWYAERFGVEAVKGKARMIPKVW